MRDPEEKLAKQLVEQSQRHIPFRRNRGTYTLDMWVKKAFDDMGENGVKAEKGKVPDGGRREALPKMTGCNQSTR